MKSIHLPYQGRAILDNVLIIYLCMKWKGIITRTRAIQAVQSRMMLWRLMITFIGRFFYGYYASYGVSRGFSWEFLCWGFVTFCFCPCSSRGMTLWFFVASCSRVKWINLTKIIPIYKTWVHMNITSSLDSTMFSVPD